MSLSIVFATDLHFRSSRPVSRLDRDYLGTLLAKLEDIRKLSERSDMVILGGDIFDRPDTPHSVVIRVNRVLTTFKVPVYSIIGNHDIYGYEGLTVDATALGSLFEMGKLRRLDTLSFPGKQGSGAVAVNIYGMHAFDKEIWKVPDSPGVKVLVSHKMITGTPIPNCKVFTLEEIAEATNADLVLSGDIHTPHQKSIEVGGSENGIGRHVMMVNPGSMARQSIIDRDRVPQAAMIEISDSGQVSSHMLPLTTRPPESVFDLKHYSERMASEAHTDEFVRTYVNAVVSVKAESGNVSDVLIGFLEKNGAGDKMRKAMMEYLARAEKEVLQETKE